MRSIGNMNRRKGATLRRQSGRILSRGAFIAACGHAFSSPCKVATDGPQTSFTSAGLHSPGSHCEVDIQSSLHNPEWMYCSHCPHPSFATRISTWDTWKISPWTMVNHGWISIAAWADFRLWYAAGTYGHSSPDDRHTFRFWHKLLISFRRWKRWWVWRKWMGRSEAHGWQGERKQPRCFDQPLHTCHLLSWCFMLVFMSRQFSRLLYVILYDLGSSLSHVRCSCN